MVAPAYIRHSILGQNTRPTEWCLAFLTMAWGGWVMIPLWHTFSVMPSYRWIEGYINEDILGLLVLAVGFTRVVGLVRSDVRLRMASAFFASCFWAAQAWTTAAHTFPTVLIPIFFVLWAIAVWVYTAISYQGAGSRE